MNLSYWEKKSWFSKVDFTIVGSGIVGLNCALSLKSKYPKATILILEKGMFPQGASTKNAGFACFGSLSEIIDDLKSHSEEEVLSLIRKRWDGLQLLRRTIGDKNLDYLQNGGYELFSENDHLLEESLSKREAINNLIHPIFKKEVFTTTNNIFNFKNIKNQYVFNGLEGQLDTGKMMVALLQLVLSKGIKIVNNCAVESYEEQRNSVKIKTTITEFTTGKLLIATNGFANQFLKEDIQPARAQVLITKPIKNLAIKGTFHLDKGFYYFRNIDNRILFGGARNLDFKTEETTNFGLTTLVQNKLEELLTTCILPDISFEIEQRWSGIMGVGNQKKAIVKPLSSHVYCGVRLGGMGVAIGSLIGKELADLL
tara:strand:- start:210425 stop:211534 length:1110 start_codon:yes stop_codon:yes gene_type:complete